MSENAFYDLKQTANMTLSLPSQLARELGRRIVSGMFEPGTLIEDENSLAERYRVSRIAVREAVKILVGKGLLDVRRGIGTRVMPRHRWMLLDDDVMAWHLSAPPSKKFLLQLFEIRQSVEPKAAAWAAERASEEEIEQIRIAVEKMSAEQNSTDQFIVADALFHKAVLRAANNEFLAAFEGVIYSALLISVRVTNKDPRENGASVPFHRDVYHAILNRDAKLAEELTQKLLDDAVLRLRQALIEEPEN